jgi:carbon monoxide dehydrogenase subunit G
MKIENSFTVDAPVDEAWNLLTDIPTIAPCLPGAKLTGEEDGVYSGGVKVKVGPVTAEYKGSAEFVEKDDENHKAVINGKGRDTRGAGNAQALITAVMEQVGDQTRVDIVTDLKVSGKVAQFGRGVMQDVSEKLLGQFAECLATKIGDEDTVDAVAAASAAVASDGAAAVESAGADAAAAVDGAEETAMEKADDAAESAVDAVADAVGDVAGKAAAMGGAAVAGVGAAAAKLTGSDDDDEDEEVLDLLDVAGGAVFKRFIPVAIAAVVLIVILVLLFT